MQAFLCQSVQEGHGHRMSTIRIKYISAAHGLHDEKDDIPRMVFLGRRELQRLNSIPVIHPGWLDTQLTFLNYFHISILRRNLKNSLLHNIGKKKESRAQTDLGWKIVVFETCSDD